jgi:hypothetical protein
MADLQNNKTGGREKGVVNKTTAQTRELFQSLVDANAEQIKLDLAELKPVERVKAIIELAKFCVPTLKAIDYTDNTPVEKQPVKIIFESK